MINLYENIMKRLEDKNIKVVVDATKNLLLNVLKYNPFLIKPNNHELEEMFNVKLKVYRRYIYSMLRSYKKWEQEMC